MPPSSLRAKRLIDCSDRVRVLGLFTGEKGDADQLTGRDRRRPRGIFLPARIRDPSYDEQTLTLAYEQTISQPLMVAMMNEFPGLAGSDRSCE